MNPIRLISSMASRDLLRELASRFESARRQQIEVVAAGGVEVAQRVRGGEAVDVVVLARTSIDGLAKDGFLLAATVMDLAQSGIAVAVPVGDPAPDLSTEAAVRAAVAAAPSIGYSTGPSGVYLEKKFEAWGLMHELRPRLVIAPPGVPVGSLVAEGKVHLGFQQLSELINLEGIQLAGSLPPELQLITTFSGAVARSSDVQDAASALLSYMASPETAAVKTRFGMQPGV